MTTQQDLIEFEEIKQLKARYFRTVDTFDLEGWLEVFTDDAVATYEAAVGAAGLEPDKRYTVRGKEDLTQFWRTSGRVQSVHHGHMPEIELLSPTEARGIWAMEDIVEFPTNMFHGYGHYWETYRKEAGHWRIATLRLTRVRFRSWTWESGQAGGLGF